MISEYKRVEENDIINNRFAFTYAPADPALPPALHLPLFFVLFLLIFFPCSKAFSSVFLFFFPSFYCCSHSRLLNPYSCNVSCFSVSSSFLSFVFPRFLLLFLSLYLLCCFWLCCCLSALFSIPSPRVLHSGIRPVFWSCVLCRPFRSHCVSFYFPFSVSLTTSMWVHFFFLWRFHLTPGHGLPLLFFTITLVAHTTLDRTPPDERSARHSDLYLTTHNIHARQTSILPAGFEPTISSSERPQTQTIDRAATWTRHMNVDYTCSRDRTLGIMT